MLNFDSSLKAGAARIIRVVAREAKQASKELDLAIKPIPRVCSSGCSHCCHQIVDVHSWEAEEISRYVIEEMTAGMRTIVANQLQDWHNWFDSVARKSTHNNPLTFPEIRQLNILAAHNHIACPYLVDSKCSIYPARPAVCRMHIVKEDPKGCQKNPLRESDIDRIPLFQKFTGPGRFDLKQRDFFFRPLPYLMIEGLNVTVQSRPMLGWGWDETCLPKR